MADSTTNVVSTKRSKVYVGTADDAAGTYTTGDISGLIKRWEMPISANTGDETVLDAEVGQTHKDINDITVSITWKGTETAITRAIEYALQDSSKEYPLRISPFGIAAGKTFYAGTGVFTLTTPSGQAKQGQQLQGNFMFNTFETGTHA